MPAKEGKLRVFRANCQLDKFSFYNKRIMRILITLIEKIIYNQVLYPSNTFNDLISSADEIIIF